MFMIATTKPNPTSSFFDFLPDAAYQDHRLIPTTKTPMLFLSSPILKVAVIVVLSARFLDSPKEAIILVKINGTCTSMTCHQVPHTRQRESIACVMGKDSVHIR